MRGKVVSGRMSKRTNEESSDPVSVSQSTTPYFIVCQAFFPYGLKSPFAIESQTLLFLSHLRPSTLPTTANPSPPLP